MTSPERPASIVELDVFSGRPNPVWTLSPEDGRRLEAMLDNLPNGRPVQLPDLGYRGFVIRFDDAKTAIPPEIRIFAGVVQRGEERFSDIHGMEAWLARRARVEGWGPLVDHIADP